MRWPSICVVSAALLSASAAQEPRTQRLAAELDRVRADLANAPDAERTNPLQRLDRAKTALDANRPLLALYLTEAPWEAGKAWSFITAAADVTTAEAFEKKWTAVGEPKAAPAPAGTRRLALVEALAASAEARGPTTYHASRFYGEDAGVPGGLYYLGESHAVMQFAAFARSLDWPVAGAAPPLRSIATEIGALDVEMATAYETMSRENHSTYIVASAALKQARTLEDRGQFGGALFQYLLSRYLFAGLRGPATQEATEERIAASRATLDPGVDNSIAELFLQLAGEGVAGSVPAQRRGAAAAVEDVIPAYLRAVAPITTTASPSPSAQVRVTLVRWPFT
jgi:hypothetical protein